MLYYVTRELHSYTIDDFLACFRRCGLAVPDFVRPITYETLFANKRAPIGNYVFTDLDRLTGYEIDAAAEIARALSAVSDAAVINWPNRVLGRYALLRRLREAGLNSFDVWRLDEHRTPTHFFVFIRREQDALGPESRLLHDEAEYRAAIEALQESGKGLGGRIAVQFCQQPDAGGLYRKHGAFCFRGQVVPQHLFLSTDWNVKRSSIQLSPAMIEEEERYEFGNPHAEQLRAIFALAQIDFGRVDYAIVDHRIEVFSRSIPTRLFRACGSTAGSARAAAIMRWRAWSPASAASISRSPPADWCDSGRRSRSSTACANARSGGG
jgi:hypothetical protein